MNTAPPTVPNPPSYSISIYFPPATHKLMLSLMRDINRMYSNLGAEAELYMNEYIGMLSIFGNDKEYVIKSVAFIARKTDCLQSSKHKE